MNEYCVDFLVDDIAQFDIVDAYDEDHARVVFERTWGDLIIVDINEMTPRK